MKNLVIYGAGGHGKVVLDAAYKSGRRVLGFVDDRAPVGFEVFEDYPVIAKKVEDLLPYWENKFEIVVAIGDNKTRLEKMTHLLELDIPIATIIHPAAVISTYSGVQRGAVVCAGVVLNAHSYVGVGAIVNTGATIDHDSIVGNYAHICPGTHMGGNVTVKEGAHVSIGCSVRDKVCIGKWSVVGVGSVVVKDIPNNVVAYGCPARVHKEL